jgi:hypothetical protein
LTAASCSTFNAAARASAAATSMSWALAGFETGAGGPGTGPLGRAIGPGVGAAGDVGADGRRGGAGRAEVRGSVGAAAGAAGADEPPGADAAKPSRRRRATGASTVLDADLTNSPISFSLASTVLLSTPSSFASSCTRALPATALLTLEVVRAAPAATSLVHLKPGHFRDFIVCSCWSSYLAWSGGASTPPSVAPYGVQTARTCSANSAVSRTPTRRNARPNARRRSASAKQAGSGCRCAPRPGSLRPGSGRSVSPTATNRSRSVAGTRSRQPTHVRVGVDTRPTT